MSEFNAQVDSLAEKFAELLTGETSPEIVEKIKLWAIYSHIHKTMPNLVSHWSLANPEAKAEMRKLIDEIRELNQKHKEG